MVSIFMRRDMLRLRRKILSMREKGTPEEVIAEEKEFNVSKLVGSLRNRFVAFLFVVGFVLVSTAKLFRYYELGVVLLLPVVLLVGVPYLMSKVMSVLRRRMSA